MLDGEPIIAWQAPRPLRVRCIVTGKLLSAMQGFVRVRFSELEVTGALGKGSHSLYFLVHAMPLGDLTLLSIYNTGRYQMHVYICTNTLTAKPKK